MIQATQQLLEQRIEAENLERRLLQAQFRYHVSWYHFDYAIQQLLINRRLYFEVRKEYDRWTLRMDKKRTNGQGYGHIHRR